MLSAVALLMLTQSAAVPASPTCADMMVDSAAKNLERAGFDTWRAGADRVETEWVRLRLSTTTGEAKHTTPVRVVLTSSKRGTQIRVRQWNQATPSAEVMQAVQKAACEAPRSEITLRAEARLGRTSKLDRRPSVLLSL